MIKTNLIKKQFSFFKNENGKNNFIEVYFKNNNLWLSQKLMSELFGVEIPAINKHLKNIFESLELEENKVISIMEITYKMGHTEGIQQKKVKFYNLDCIISVGYRINSKKATDFRIWATKNLKEFVLKGYILDDERLKQGEDLDKNYFKELLERIRSIRTSERRIYQQITDIFSECSIDYDKNSNITKEFFSTIQNKFHYAITNNTGAEIIYNKANHKKKNMGLMSFKNKDRILKSDIKIAKNYLSEKEIKKLERAITSFFDYIENLIERERKFTMEEFKNSVDKFLSFNEYKILENKGKISKLEAEKKALNEYEIFNKNQIIESDFDEISKKFLEGKK
jgi:hypothetical protein